MKKMISRRNFLAVAGAAAAAGVLTACVGSSASTAASSASGSAAAASGDTIKVGVLGPMTGDVSVYGLAVINGASLYLKQVNEKGGDSAFRWMWLTIVLSFGFYIPVVLWVDTIPMIGMLMIPKTCAYVWTVLIGYSAMKKECR